jgi:large subunit ribosomal protein L11
MGFTLPVEITVFEDRSYAFKVKQPLMTDLIKKAMGIEKGSSNPSKESAGTLTREQALSVVKLKIADLNTDNEEQALRIVAGSARSMGIDANF